MTRPALTKPALPSMDLRDLRPGDPETLVAGRRYDAFHFADADLAGYDLRGATFMEVAWDGVRTDGAVLRNVRLVENRIRGMSGAALSAAGSSWRDVELSDSRVGALDAGGCEWRNVRLAHSKIGFLNLRQATCVDVTFADCSIDELDLGQATAQRVSFAGCRIGSLSVVLAKLSHFDLRAAELLGIAGIEGLAGATISSGQLHDLAPLLAAHLGIRVDAS